MALDDLVRSVLEDLETSIQDSGACIEVGTLPVVDADPAQLRLLFQNLLAKAIKFRKEGTAPSVRVRSAPVAASAAERSPSVLRVVVEDDGIGFEQEYADRIFRPFERLHGRERFEGTGIGLSICRRVMENHEGAIGAEGRPGRGARFVLSFPYTATQELP